jgi:hypothetical protein
MMMRVLVHLDMVEDSTDKRDGIAHISFTQIDKASMQKTFVMKEGESMILEVLENEYTPRKGRGKRWGKNR